MDTIANKGWCKPGSFKVVINVCQVIINRLGEKQYVYVLLICKQVGRNK